MAGKTLYSSNTLWPPPRTYPRDSKAKRATGSEKVTSWFSGWECAIRMMQGLAASARKQRREKAKRSRTKFGRGRTGEKMPDPHAHNKHTLV